MYTYHTEWNPHDLKFIVDHSLFIVHCSLFIVQTCIGIVAFEFSAGRKESHIISSCIIHCSATGHTEAVVVLYDPNECTYESLLDTFFGRVDPLTVNGQGNDRGSQYRTGVYYHSKEQDIIAKERFELEQGKYAKRKIATECKQALPFWPAEKYHQQYLAKGGRTGSGQSAEKGSTDTIRCYG